MDRLLWLLDDIDDLVGLIRLGLTPAGCFWLLVWAVAVIAAFAFFDWRVATSVMLMLLVAVPTPDILKESAGAALRS